MKRPYDLRTLEMEAADFREAIYRARKEQMAIAHRLAQARFDAFDDLTGHAAKARKR